MFEKEFEKFLGNQKKGAVGQRLEHLKRDLSGERKMMETVVWPIFGSFEGWILEFEVIGPGGVRIYIDAFYVPFRWALECEGFAVHAEMITRDRFSFERARIRALASHSITYLPFSRNELDKKPDACRKSIYELLGQQSSPGLLAAKDLTIYERELIRMTRRLGRPLKLADACAGLDIGKSKALTLIKQLSSKRLFRPIGQGTARFHAHELTEEAWKVPL